MHLFLHEKKWLQLSEGDAVHPLVLNAGDDTLQTSLGHPAHHVSPQRHHHGHTTSSHTQQEQQRHRWTERTPCVVKLCLCNRFRTKIPPQKLSMQRGEPVLPHYTFFTARSVCTHLTPGDCVLQVGRPGVLRGDEAGRRP